MNIAEYLLNPMGRGSAVLALPARRRELESQYKDLCSKIRLTWYILGDKFYIAHVKIPSHRHERIYYDVLIQFDIDSIASNSSVINDCSVRVFSNCPSFTYTYAYIFNKRKDLIEWARKKYPSEVLSKEPMQRNPYQVLSYERSLYFAFRYITSNGRNYVDLIKSTGIKVTSYTRILSSVQSTNQVKELSDSLIEKKKGNHQQKQIKKKISKKDDIKVEIKHGVNKTPSTHKTKTVKKSKKTKKI